MQWPGYAPQPIRLSQSLPANPTRGEFLHDLARHLDAHVAFFRVRPPPHPPTHLISSRTNLKTIPQDPTCHPSRAPAPLPTISRTYALWDLAALEHFSGNVCIGGLRLVQPRDPQYRTPVWVVDLAVDTLMHPARDMAVEAFRLLMLTDKEWHWAIADVKNDPQFAMLFNEAVRLT